MRFLLMNKNIEVAEIRIDNSFTKVELLSVKNPDFLPLHVQYASNNINALFSHWFIHRTIPKGRDGIDNFMLCTPYQNTLELSVRNRSLSLTDHYWLKNPHEQITWEKVNLFQNNYSQEIGNIIMGTQNGPINNYYSPDITTNGWLKKAWRRDDDGIDYLFKLGSAPFYQEPINEVFCSELMEKFCGLDFVKYTLGSINGNYCSICENFVTQKEAFVPAFEIYQTAPKPKAEEAYRFLVKRCEAFDIKGAATFIEAMMAFDYLVHNTDRHMGNFGFMRDADTLEFTRVAPLFDNGSCLLGGDVNNISKNISNNKLFHNWQIDQIRFIKHWDAFNLSEVKEMSDRLYDLLKSVDIEISKIDEICKEYDDRWAYLNQLMQRCKERKHRKMLERDESELTL